LIFRLTLEPEPSVIALTRDDSDKCFSAIKTPFLSQVPDVFFAIERGVPKAYTEHCYNQKAALGKTLR
jgi:hypothetical protein